MSAIDSFQGFYRDALRAKADYEGALLQLRDAAAKCKGERDAITKRLHSEHPEIVREMCEAYGNGERVNWQTFDICLKKIEEIYPPPPLFRWNGRFLQGPNLYKDFGIAETVCG